MIGFRIGRVLLCGALGGAFMAGVVTAGGALAAACLAKKAVDARCAARSASKQDAELSPG
ncbi:hypothetical protein [Plastoroseomonas hellenica]|uniref:hypothetical protein n=1 Tax=Plastoroseomonas hellenica TaxID=2687306 RepID=UPI001BACA00B|nr:hypothetical protein [Plastoroseomonas hellenica]MBR0641845.1 hypothetical protein [Plastoroseomonas hellenica]